MSAREPADLVKLIRRLEEIVSNAELTSGCDEITRQLKEMEQTATEVQHKLWYQSKVVSDVVI